MAKQNNDPQATDGQKGSDELGDYVSIPATRHVGPTLESEPGYFERVRAGGSTGFSSPEEQIAAEGTSPEVSATGDGTDLAATISGSYDASSTEPSRDREPEALKTRLPGDTSSDPHTDLGPDNATSVQRRGEQ